MSLFRSLSFLVSQMTHIYYIAISGAKNPSRWLAAIGASNTLFFEVDEALIASQLSNYEVLYDM